MTTSRVTIVDYGIGNLLSAQRAFAAIGHEARIESRPEAVADAGHLVVPGVGAFGDCIRALRMSGFVEPLRAHVRAGKPLLGICVGMQMLFDGSEEFGNHDGLGLLPGRVRRIPDVAADGRRLKIPHIGWSALEVPTEAGADRWEDTILEGIATDASVYFVHSYTGWPDNPSDRLADAFHGGQRICAAIQHDNISGTQFHPEKSGTVGLRIIRNFVERL